MNSRQRKTKCVRCGKRDTLLAVRMDQVAPGTATPWRCPECYHDWLKERDRKRA